MAQRSAPIHIPGALRSPEPTEPDLIWEEMIRLEPCKPKRAEQVGSFLTNLMPKDKPKVNPTKK